MRDHRGVPVDTEIRSLAAALGHPPPIPKHALATLRDTVNPADIATLHLGHTHGDDTVAVIATTADRVIIAVNRPRTNEPLHDVALADLDACVAVTTSGTEPSTLVLVPTDPTAPLIVTEMHRHQADKVCAAIRKAMPPTHSDQRAGHWSAALPADLSVVVAGRLLNDPTRPVTAPHRAAAAVTSTGVVLVHRHHDDRQGRRGPRASFVRWASVDTVDIDTVHPQHPARPAPPTRVRRVTTTTAPSGAVLRLGTPTGNWVIEAKSVQPSTLRTDLTTVLVSAPTAAPDPDCDPERGDEMAGVDASPATAGPLTPR